MVNGIHLYESKHLERYRIRVHFHHFYQLLFVIEGEGSISIGEAIYQVQENDVIIIFPFTKHAVSSQKRMTLLILSFEETVLEAMIAHQNKEDVGFTSSFCSNLTALQANEVKLLLRKLLQEERQQALFSDWAVRTYLSEILLVLCRARHTDCVQDSNHLRAEKIRSYIDQYYFESLTAELLAQKFGISVRYANTLFKERYKRTPIQYLNEVRHSRTKSLLIETDMNIASLCFEVGYESLPTFYRSFKQFAQMSPNQYRSIYRHENRFRN